MLLRTTPLAPHLCHRGRMPSWDLLLRFLCLLTALINRHTRTRLHFAAVRFDLLSKSVLIPTRSFTTPSLMSVPCSSDCYGNLTRAMVRRKGEAEAVPHVCLASASSSSSFTVLYVHRNRMAYYRQGEEWDRGMRAQAHLPFHTAPDL